ncbi:hypothetical protein [Thalassobium sp. R2A62]|jgi:hypothetical protein|nr:hypothetical protein [Thalassobium sp. R2A62]EET48225.1 hypothetical protein TR2A62_0112 [Thalassobium sp. R2A62]MDG1340089.1 hypothetical protein [Paracoccaceae bacterium]
MINHSTSIKGLPCALSQLLQNGATKLRIGVVAKVNSAIHLTLTILAQLD